MPNNLTSSSPKPRISLTDPQKIYMATLMARYVPAQEVVDKVKDEFDKDITVPYVYSLMKSVTFGPLIAKFRRQWKLMLEEVPVYNKKFRLEKIQGALDRLEQEKASNSLDRREARRDLISLLREAREEAERYKSGDTTNILAIQFANMSDEELLARKQEVLTAIAHTGSPGDSAHGKRVAP